MTSASLSWRPDRSIIVSADDAEVWMFGGDGPVRLAGRGAGPLARAVDAGGDEETIVASAESAGLARDRAREILGKWRASGHVVDRASAVGPTPASVRVIDATDGLDDAQLLSEALRAIGVDVHDSPGALPVVVVPHALAMQGADQVPDGPYVAVSMRGARAVVSPVLVPGERGRCPACLDARLRHRLSAEVVGAQRVGLAVPPAHPIRHPSSVAAAAAAVAQIATASEWERQVVAFDVSTAAMQRYVVVPVPGCAACEPGGPTARMRHLEGPLSLEDATFDDGGGGGYRTVDPEDTMTSSVWCPTSSPGPAVSCAPTRPG
jgi:bacteriocin biosynthesis cyclodehydratase domain-containing protein